MLLDDIATRVQPVFKQVATAINLRDVITQPIHQDNLAFVVPVSERPAGNSRDSDVGNPLQEVIITFGVVIGLKSINDQTGSTGIAPLEKLRDEARALLYGHTPAGHSAILLSSSDLLGFAANGIWWLDRFTTTIYRTGTA